MTSAQHSTSLVILYHDADSSSLTTFEKHLYPMVRENHLRIWHRGKIPPGVDQQLEITRRLEEADVVLMLLSSDFLAAIDANVVGALASLHPRRRRIVPILLRPCILPEPLNMLQPIPRDQQPLLQGSGIAEERLQGAVREVLDLVQDISAHKTGEDDKPPNTRPGGPLGLLVANLERENHALRQLAIKGITSADASGSLREQTYEQRTRSTEPIFQGVTDVELVLHTPIEGFNSTEFLAALRSVVGPSIDLVAVASVNDANAEDPLGLPPGRSNG